MAESTSNFEWRTVTNRFILEVDGVEIGTFTEVSGLNVEVSEEQIEEGGQNHFVHRVPGRMTWPNIVLKRGLVENDNLFEWFWKTSGDGYAKENKLERHSAAITMTSEDGDRLRSWRLDGVFPVKWTGPELAASSSDRATEELEIAHHGFLVQT